MILKRNVFTIKRKILFRKKSAFFGQQIAIFGVRSAGVTEIEFKEIWDGSLKSSLFSVQQQTVEKWKQNNF